MFEAKNEYQEITHVNEIWAIRIIISWYSKANYCSKLLANLIVLEGSWDKDILLLQPRIWHPCSTAILHWFDEYIYLICLLPSSIKSMNAGTMTSSSVIYGTIVPDTLLMFIWILLNRKWVFLKEWSIHLFICSIQASSFKKFINKNM